jgi:hypothetical protein
MAHLTDDCNARLTLQEDAESNLYKYMIIDNEDPHHPSDEGRNLPCR